MSLDSSANSIQTSPYASPPVEAMCTVSYSSEPNGPIQMTCVHDGQTKAGTMTPTATAHCTFQHININGAAASVIVCDSIEQIAPPSQTPTDM